MLTISKIQTVGTLVEPVDVGGKLVQEVMLYVIEREGDT